MFYHVVSVMLDVIQNVAFELTIVPFVSFVALFSLHCLLSVPYMAGFSTCVTNLFNCSSYLISCCMVSILIISPDSVFLYT